MNPTTPNSNSPYIVSSAPVWQDFNSATKSLNGIINTPDPYMSLFQNQLASNAQSTENAIASATANTARQKIASDQREQQLEAGLNTAAEKTGLQPNSAYQMQVIDDTRARFNTQINLIDQTEKLAIAKAKAAQMAGDTAVLKEQLNYINDLRKQKADALFKENQLAWEKEKFRQEMGVRWAAENRLSAKTTDVPKLKYTPTQLGKLRAAGIDATNTEIADNFLYNKGIAPKDFTREKILSDYDKNDLWNLALSIKDENGKNYVQRNKNLTRQDEIDKMLSNNDLYQYIQDQLSSGNTIQDIINSQNK